MSDLRIEKLSMESTDITQENINKIKELFPQVVTEGKIDFDVLKTILGEQIENQNERYQFTWNGKSETIRFAQKPSTGTLRPDKESSKNWDTTENLYIEGDNLEVLKLLQKTYHNKIKMIYIDPPYNTGGDFVYKDDFKDSIKNYKEQTNQTLRTNPETSGRYHTDWLNMMYSRLMLARILMADDALIFISINDSEMSSIKKICDEIFGETNCVANLIWDRNHSAQAGIFKVYHEYIFVYCKYIDNIETPKSLNNDLFEAGAIKKESARHAMQTFRFPKGTRFDASNGTELVNQWGGLEKVILKSGRMISNNGFLQDDVELEAAFTQVNQMFEYFYGDRDKLIDSRGQKIDEFYFSSTGKLKVVKKRGVETPPTIFKFGAQGPNSRELSELFGLNETPFDSPKPINMIKEFLVRFTEKNDIIIDFFSGSSTTAHAVMQLNAEDKGSRQFIMVQLPEKIDEKSEAFKAGYNNICEIGKERIRRAGEKIKNELVEKNQKAGMLEDSVDPDKLDIGFKVYKLDSSNFNVFDSTSKDINNIFNHDVFLSDRSQLDILYEILLKYGVFDKPVEVLNINNKEAYSVAFGHMLVFINQEITELDITEVVALKPREVIIDERGFKTDNDKMNAVIRLEAAGVEKISTI